MTTYWAFPKVKIKGSRTTSPELPNIDVFQKTHAEYTNFYASYPLYRKTILNVAQPQIPKMRINLVESAHRTFEHSSHDTHPNACLKCNWQVQIGPGR